MTPIATPFAVAALVTRVLEQLGIVRTMGGSIAASFAGDPRSTVDIDVVAALDDARLKIAQCYDRPGCRGRTGYTDARVSRHLWRPSTLSFLSGGQPTARPCLVMATAVTGSPASPSPSSDRSAHARAKLRELFGVDLRSLALLRIGLGVSVLADVSIRAFDVVGLYTDRGVLPRDLLLAMEGRGVYLSAHYWASAHPLLQVVLFAVTAACAVALLVGWRTRLATLACWYLVASVQIRQPLGYMGGDSILRLLLFWGLFLPLAARFSLDASHGRERPGPDRFVSGATVALLLQVCLIYWVTGIRKEGGLWWSGEAVFYALHAESWFTPFGAWLRDFPALLQPITYMTLGLELLGPLLAFVPLRTAECRLAAIALFWSSHLGLAAAMHIGLFPLFSMVAWLPFIPTQAWTWLGASTSTSHDHPPGWRARVRSVAAAVCLAYIFVLLAERARIIPRLLPAEVTAVGRALRIQQSWGMFAPDPSTVSSRREIRKTWADGSQVTEPASTSFRWTVYLRRAATPLPPEHPLAKSLQRFVHLRCQDSRPGTTGRIERIAILVHVREIHSDGFGEPGTLTLVDASCPRGPGP